jgi:hypothetical protein
VGKPNGRNPITKAEIVSKYNPYTRAGQIRARGDFLFLGLEANNIGDTLRGIFDPIELGSDPTIEEVFNKVMSKIESRALYPKRLLNVCDYVERLWGQLDHFGDKKGIIGPDGKERFGNVDFWKKAFERLRCATEKLVYDSANKYGEGEMSVAEQINNLSALIVRDVFGEVEGHGGMVDPIQSNTVIDWVHSKLPHLPTP